MKTRNKNKAFCKVKVNLLGLWGSTSIYTVLNGMRNTLDKEEVNLTRLFYSFRKLQKGKRN